jgi:hypothetical protein
MHEIFFLSDILFTSCYFTYTCLVLEISLFGPIAVNIVVKVFHIWHSDPYMVMEQIKIFVPWIFQLSFCTCGHNLLFPTIFKYWWYEISVIIPVSTFTIDFVFENCFLSAITPYVDSRDVRSLSIYGSECQIKVYFISFICFTNVCRV